MKGHRFFFHFRKQDKRMSVHYRGQCVPCNEVVCLVPCETKRNKRQPLLVMQGYASGVRISKHDEVTTAIIE